MTQWLTSFQEKNSKEYKVGAICLSLSTLSTFRSHMPSFTQYPISYKWSTLFNRGGKDHWGTLQRMLPQCANQKYILFRRLSSSNYKPGNDISKYIHSDKRTQTNGLRAQFCIVFLLAQHCLIKITGFSIIHSFFFLLHGVVQTSCYQPLYVLRHFSQVKVFETLWTIVHQASLSMGFSRQEYWSGLSFPSGADRPHLGIESVFPALAGKPVHNAKAQIPC